jgi:hypothetical protein
VRTSDALTHRCHACAVGVLGAAITSRRPRGAISVNRDARSLITGRSDQVGFLLSEPQERFFADPDFNVLLRGCTQALAGHDIPMLLMPAGTACSPPRT